MANTPNLDYAKYVLPPPFRRLRAAALILLGTAIIFMLAETAMEFGWLPWNLRIDRLLRVASALPGFAGAIASLIAWVRNWKGRAEIVAMVASAIYLLCMATMFVLLY